jgi:hypothetical protein
MFDIFIIMVVIICIGSSLWIIKRTDNDRKMYSLTEELAQLSRKLITIKLDDNDIRRTSYHVEELFKINQVLAKPLNKDEERELRINLKLIIQLRFNNYKNGTKQDSRQIKNSATIRVKLVFSIG